MSPKQSRRAPSSDKQLSDSFQNAAARKQPQRQRAESASSSANKKGSSARVATRQSARRTVESISVERSPSTGMEDVDQFFNSAGTPDSTKQSPAKASRNRSAKQNRKPSKSSVPTTRLSKAAATPQQRVQFQLPDDPSANASANPGTANGPSAATIANVPSKQLSQSSRSKRKRLTADVDDLDMLSPVATAPPSPVPTPSPPPSPPAEDVNESMNPEMDKDDIDQQKQQKQQQQIPDASSPQASQGGDGDVDDRGDPVDMNMDVGTGMDIQDTDDDDANASNKDFTTTFLTQPQEVIQNQGQKRRGSGQGVVDATSLENDDGEQLPVPPPENDDDENEAMLAMPADEGDSDDTTSEVENADLVPPNRLVPADQTPDHATTPSMERDAIPSPNMASPNALDGINDNVGGDEDDMDDDGEGGGFNVVDDAVTPPRTRRSPGLVLSNIKSSNSRRSKRHRRRSHESRASTEQSVASETSQSMASPEPVGANKRGKRSKQQARSRNIFSPPPAGNREYTQSPVRNRAQVSPEDRNVRRSKRNKTKPLQFWKNEKLVYGAHEEEGELGELMGDMPVVISVQKALKTPKKTRPAKAARPTIKFNPTALRKKYAIEEGNKAELWDEDEEQIRRIQVVAYAADMVEMQMPIQVGRTKSEGLVSSFASSGFDVKLDPTSKSLEGFIMGSLRLPPKGIKDPDTVGQCLQTYTVCSCQPETLELAFRDPRDEKFRKKTATRFLLSPGDLFCVPPYSSYRLQNHSPTMECIITWTVVKLTDDAGSGDEDM